MVLGQSVVGARLLASHAGRNCGAISNHAFQFWAQSMRVLVGYEFSGRVRQAFIERGHDAISVDLEPTEIPGPHYQGDIFEFLDKSELPDLALFHPPCTYTAVSGARWFSDPERKKQQRKAIRNIKRLWALPIRKLAIEQPISVVSTLWKKPTQIVHPWQFGVPEMKATYWYTRGLPLLLPTNIVPEELRKPVVHHEPPSKDRQKNRSRTPWGMAYAYAAQWG